MAITTSTAIADSGPYATVDNSKGEAVGKWGSFYGDEPGSQIQMAENFAECGHTESCSSFPEKPLYPKVVLEPGTYEILKAYGAHHSVYPYCEGIFAYSGVVLQGAPSYASVIQNDLGSNPCEASEKQENELGWGEVTAVVYVGANPTNDNVAGTALLGLNRSSQQHGFQ